MYIDPEFAPLFDTSKSTFDKIWSADLNDCRNSWLAPVEEEIPLGPKLSELISRVDSVTVSDGEKIQILIYSPKSISKPLPLLFVTHGGGWVVGSHSMEETLMRNVCVKNNFVVVSVDYRLAPEFPFPYAVNDSFEVLKWCQKNAAQLQIDPNRIILAGASAGGNLAAVLAIKSRDEGLSGIIGQILNIPVTCHPQFFPKTKYAYTSYEENKGAPIVDSKQMYWFWDQYLPKVEKDAYHSPLIAESLSNLPPALIQVAGMDPLRDEGKAYAEALKNSGVDVTLNLYPGLPHGFSAYPHLTKSPIYHQSVVDWINKNFTGA